MKIYIKPFNNILLSDVPLVGGKNASLGEMFNRLGVKGVPVPDGYATTSAAFWYFIDHNKLRQPIEKLLTEIERPSYSNLRDIGLKIRTLLLNAVLPEDLAMVWKSMLWLKSQAMFYWQKNLQKCLMVFQLGQMI